MSSDLLPYNATGPERAMANAVSRVSDVPVPVGDVWNPDACPAALLPWLAWALSVDIWDPDWTEPQKRAAVAESIEIHRRKGTVWATRTALSRVLEASAVTEWFEWGGDPYFYRISTTSGLVSAEWFADRVMPSIRAAKNVRSWLEFIEVRRELETDLTLTLTPLAERRLFLKTRMALDATIRPFVAVAPMIWTRRRFASRD